MTKVTIILSTYNRCELLSTAIRSIIRQSFTDWRLLVINDGGENVQSVVDQFHDIRIEYFNRPHLGKAAQMNFAIRQVQSKYIAYMDDDDEVLPNHLEVLTDVLEKTGGEFAYSDTDWVLLDEDGKEKIRKVENDRDLSFEDIRIFNYINHKQILHAKRLSDRIGPYDERLRIFIDFDYIKRLAHECKPIHVNKITGVHYLRESDQAGQIGSISGLWQRDPFEAGKSLLAFFEKDPEALVKLYWAQNELRLMADELRREKDAKERAIGELLSSKSWRMTAPLRRFADWFRKCGTRNRGAK